MKEYDLIIAPRVVQQIKSIKEYIENVKLVPEIAEKIVSDIFDDISNLKNFPERGFNADDKLGTKIDKAGRDSKGITIQKGNYIVIYSIDEKHNKVEVAYLFSTKTNYAKLFLL